MKKNKENIHILIFTRYPAPGRVKTRLITALGAEGATRLHRRMTESVVEAVRRVEKPAESSRIEGVKITVCYTGSSRKEVRAWLGKDLSYSRQSSGDLGARMKGSIKEAFEAGARAVLLMGTDIPEITPEILLRAMDGLRDRDIVLGPSTDGGYYLIGLKAPHPAVFEAMDWGTERVYGQTARTIARCGLTMLELPRLKDVDRPADLAPLRRDPRFEDVFAGRSMISIVIPTLNESANIGRLLKRLSRAQAVESLVVDGGSEDDTCGIAKGYGALVLNEPGGRAAQQNLGAAAAKGRLLLFLHADTLPPDGYAERIRRALDRPATVAGAFRFKTDGTGFAMRLVERATNFRSGVLQFPYGDQGLFMEKRVFLEMGGFAPMPIMEDFELVRRLRRRGTVVTVPCAVVTSARRWRHLGVVRTTVINQLMIAGFISGVPLQRLQGLYRRGANRSASRRPSFSTR